MAVAPLFKIPLNAIVNQRLLVTTVNMVSRLFYSFTWRPISFLLARKRSLSTAPCANVTCLNGGECHTDDNGAHCTCPKPYFGERCELGKYNYFALSLREFQLNVNLVNRPRTCNPSPCGNNGQCVTTKEGHKCVCKNGTTGVLCEQKIMPESYRWCPLDCHSGTTCVYEGSTPKCRVLYVWKTFINSYKIHSIELFLEASINCQLIADYIRLFSFCYLVFFSFSHLYILEF